MFGGDKNKKLLKAVDEGNIEKVKKYLGKGADLETRNNVQYTALMIAAWKGLHELVSFLLSQGANKDAVDSWGNTALLLAISMNNADAARILLEKKANMKAKNNEGKNAKDLAVTAKMKSLIASFEPTPPPVVIPPISAVPRPAPTPAVNRVQPSAPPMLPEITTSYSTSTSSSTSSSPSAPSSSSSSSSTSSSSSISIRAGQLTHASSDRLPPPTHTAPSPYAPSTSSSSSSSSSPSSSRPRPSLAPIPSSSSAIEPDLTRIPHEFMCPISMEIMVHPVITTAGMTYERACIEEWFRKGNSTDPMAHVPVMKILTPNIALKQQIESFNSNFALFAAQKDQREQQREQEDSNLAMQLRVEELTRSMQSKMQRLDHMQT
eukprot:gene26800-35129_t